MNYCYNGASVAYKFVDRGSKSVVVFLHGWGRSGEDFKPFENLFENKSLLILDFPPFGESEFDPSKWSIFSYANMVISLCESLEISSCDFIGHSFGGRIAIIIAALKCSLVHSCILVDSAGLKPKRTIKYRYKVFKHKICKKFGKVSNSGSRDYQALSPEMKELFKNIVNTHLDEFCHLIKAKTLIIWGKDDKETPFYMAKRLNKKIENSRLEILENSGHFSFLEKRLEFFCLVNDFLKEEK